MPDRGFGDRSRDEVAFDKGALRLLAGAPRRDEPVESRLPDPVDIP